MARPQRCRRICREPQFAAFSPEGKQSVSTVILSVDEFEALRLVDYEKKTHEQCAAQMDISRSTVTGIYESARYKLSDALVNGKRLEIAGGTYRVCDGSAGCCCGDPCEIPEPKGTIRRIAVPYENGTVFGHFGKTKQFKFYDVDQDHITLMQIRDVPGSGPGVLPTFLQTQMVDTLVCGGIGSAAQNALAEAGIQVCGGRSGAADEAVAAILNARRDQTLPD